MFDCSLPRSLAPRVSQLILQLTLAYNPIVVALVLEWLTPILLLHQCCWSEPLYFFAYLGCYPLFELFYPTSIPATIEVEVETCVPAQNERVNVRHHGCPLSEKHILFSAEPNFHVDINDKMQSKLTFCFYFKLCNAILKLFGLGVMSYPSTSRKESNKQDNKLFDMLCLVPLPLEMEKGEAGTF